MQIIIAIANLIRQKLCNKIQTVVLDFKLNFYSNDQLRCIPSTIENWLKKGFYE